MKIIGAYFFSLSLLSIATASAFAQSTSESSISTASWLVNALEQISAERMLGDIKVLSAPALRGRQTGSQEDAASASFVANRFSELRLHRSSASLSEHRTNPLPQREWKQTSPVARRTIDDEILLELIYSHARSTLHGGVDFLPVLDSPSADLRAEIVFVGYGLSDPARGIDDYAGLDVHNKMVLFLRGKPDKYAGSAAHSDKEQLARQNGAIAYLTATGPILTAYEQRRGVTGKPGAFYSTTESVHQLPGAWISTETAEAIIVESTRGKTTLRALQEEANRTGVSRSMSLNVSAKLKWASHLDNGILFNVISIIRGYSSSDDAVLIGAHRDHFGHQAGLLFAGADDNASGTAVLLEVARVLALAPAAPKRSILFVSFSGEEQGLLGSRLYVSQPIVPLAKTIAMINVDHAGIGNGRLTIGVTGLEKSQAETFGQEAGVSDKLDLFGFFPGGDHVPFKEAGVPTLTVVSGGIHPHFHQPSDTVETINSSILQSVARYVLACVWDLANAP